MKIEIDPIIFKTGRIKNSAFKVYIWLCAYQLKNPEPLILRDIAYAVRLDETTVQKSMTLLEKQGFITREHIGRHAIIYHVLV